ncbi:hypothetical protein ACFVTC_19930 [Streptomyces sp. NPDC057950]|uniref:hypothetical protein n=1 Tax=Streptomyces sp. NPDC057950 TaxID=3346288 RepID=UPI0036E641A1
MRGHPAVYGLVVVRGHAAVYDQVVVRGHAAVQEDAAVYGQAAVRAHAAVYGRTAVRGRAGLAVPGDAAVLGGRRTGVVVGRWTWPPVRGRTRRAVL